MKYLEHTLKTYMYSHYNMCNILIYFCNIDIQHLQHISETSETLETYYRNMRFQRSICLLLGRMEARRPGAQRRCGARCHGVARRSPVWTSSVARTSTGTGVGGWSTAATGDASPGGASGVGGWLGCERGCTM